MARGHGPDWGKATVIRTKGMISRHRTALLGVLALGAALVTAQTGAHGAQTGAHGAQTGAHGAQAGGTSAQVACVLGLAKTRNRVFVTNLDSGTVRMLDART